MLRFAAKVPELGLDVRSVNMDFTYGLSFARDAPEAYETLLLDAMLGDASLFTRADEVEAAWGIVTPIIERLARVGQGRHAGQRHLLLRGRLVGSGERRRADRARRPALAKAVAADEPTARRPPDWHRAGQPGQVPTRPLHTDPEWTDQSLARARDEHLAVRREARRGVDGGRSRGIGRPDLAADAMRARRWAIRAWRATLMAPAPLVRVRMRTSVLTLVVLAPRPEISERALAAINALHQRHPSRAIVVSPGDFDGPAKMDAHIYAECKLSDRSGAEMCTEQILIKTGGELSQHLSRVVTPLLIHDLPVVLWWPDDPPFGSRQFTEIVGTADRLLVDSGSFNEDGGKRMAGLATVVANGVSVTDIGWLRLTLWRELLAGAVRPPAARRASWTTSRACASTWPGPRPRCASRRPRSTWAGWRRAWAGRSSSR